MHEGDPGPGNRSLTYVPFLPWVALPFERLDESVRIQSDAIEQSGRGMTRGASQNVAPLFEQWGVGTVGADFVLVVDGRVGNEIGLEAQLEGPRSREGRNQEVLGRLVLERGVVVPHGPSGDEQEKSERDGSTRSHPAPA